MPHPREMSLPEKFCSRSTSRSQLSCVLVSIWFQFVCSRIDTFPNSKEMMLEMCCRCGLVHRDDRIFTAHGIVYRAYKPHYHWRPPQGETTLNGVLLHATICAACTLDFSEMGGAMYAQDEGVLDFDSFFAQKRLTPDKHRVAGSWNAPLPDRMIEKASRLYASQVSALVVHDAMESPESASVALSLPVMDCAAVAVAVATAAAELAVCAPRSDSSV